MNHSTNTHIQSSRMHDHTTRDQAMSCYGYHSGAHGANHFGAHQFEAGVLVIDEQFAEMFDEGATGTRAHAIEERLSGKTVTLVSDLVDRVLAEHGPCPQGMDCFGDSRPRRILECVCTFRGCAICLERHEQSAHPELQTSGKEA